LEWLLRGRGHEGQENDRDRTRAAAFDGHLVKPVSWDALLEVLEAEHPAA